MNWKIAIQFAKLAVKQEEVSATYEIQHQSFYSFEFELRAIRCQEGFPHEHGTYISDQAPTNCDKMHEM